MRGWPSAMASLNWSRMFWGSATPEFSRMILQVADHVQPNGARGKWATQPVVWLELWPRHRGPPSQAAAQPPRAGEEWSLRPVLWGKAAAATHLSYGMPRLSDSVSRFSKLPNSSSAMLRAVGGRSRRVLGTLLQTASLLPTKVRLGRQAAGAPEPRLILSAVTTTSPHATAARGWTGCPFQRMPKPPHSIQTVCGSGGGSQPARMHAPAAGAAVGQLNCVCQVGGGAAGAHTVGAVARRRRAADQLGVDVHRGHVVHDAAHLQERQGARCVTRAHPMSRHGGGNGGSCAACLQLHTAGQYVI